MVVVCAEMLGRSFIAAPANATESECLFAGVFGFSAPDDDFSRNEVSLVLCVVDWLCPLLLSQFRAPAPVPFLPAFAAPLFFLSGVVWNVWGMNAFVNRHCG